MRFLSALNRRTPGARARSGSAGGGARARRRHPAARPLLLLCALFVIGALYAAMAPAPHVAADGATSADVEAGRKLFSTSGCASCHGMNGEGSSQGPSLVGVGAASVDFQVSTGRMPLAAPGAQAPRKKNRYSAEEVAELAAYVASLGPGLAIPSKDMYSTDGLTAEQIARGGELFRTNCSACHNFSGEGGALPKGKYAPSLVGVSDKHIWEAMRTGPQQMPVFPQTTISDENARSMIAYLQTLHASPTQGGFKLGGIGPVSEGFWAWLVGIGVLVIFAVWIAAKGARSR
ncbi:MAG: cytochrome bc1 complex diheme cytochrome c subunit [Propionibacteriaceae bacterium]